MNILLAFIIFTGIALFADPVSLAAIGQVTPGSPAEQIGLQGGAQTGTDAEGNAIFDDSGDQITAINGQQFFVFDSIGLGNDTPQGSYLRAHAGQQVALTVRHPDGTVQTYDVMLRPAEIAQTQGALGVRFAALGTEDTQRPVLDAIATGARRTADAATLILRGLGDLVANITNPPVSGPVGIVSTIGQVRSSLPPVFLVWFIGLLSANLAVVNVLPFPPLDGGRVAVSLIQAATGNRVSEAAERMVYLAGFIALMALLAWITFFDIQRLG
jgi:regulator of sigma E protease